MNRTGVTAVFSYLLITPIIAPYIPVLSSLGGHAIPLQKLALLTCAVFALATLHPEYRLELTRIDIGVVALLFVLAASVIWSIAPETTARWVDDLVLFAGFYIAVVVFLRRDGALEALSKSLLVAAGGILIYGYLSAMTGEISRDVFTWVTRNYFARDLVAILPLALTGLIGQSTWRGKTVFGAITGLIGLLVMVSGSRSGLVAFLVVAALFVAYWLHVDIRIGVLPTLAVSAAATVFIITIAVLGIQFGVLPGRLSSIPVTPDAFKPEVLGKARYRVYRLERLAVREYWLGGMGFGALPVYAEQFEWVGSFRSHNIFTRIWLAGGIGALLLFVCVFLAISRNYIRGIVHSSGDQQTRFYAFFVGLLGITLTGMANIVIIHPIFYIMLAVGACGFNSSTQF